MSSPREVNWDIVDEKQAWIDQPSLMRISCTNGRIALRALAASIHANSRKMPKLTR
jgi:hypothetical protein